MTVSELVVKKKLINETWYATRYTNPIPLLIPYQKWKFPGSQTISSGLWVQDPIFRLTIFLSTPSSLCTLCHRLRGTTLVLFECPMETQRNTFNYCLNGPSVSRLLLRSVSIFTLIYVVLRRVKRLSLKFLLSDIT